MTNDTTRSQRSLGTNLLSNSAGWSTSIWGAAPSSTRPSNGSRGSPQEAAPAVPNPLPQTTSTRSNSDSTSPTSIRDNSTYFPAAASHRPSAIGQRPVTNGTSRWTPQSIFDTNPNTQPAEYLDNSNEEQNSVMFGPNAGFAQEPSARDFRPDPRTFQALYRGAAAPTFTRDNSRGLGRQHDADPQAQGAHTSGNGYDAQAGTAGPSQHQLLSRTTEGMRPWKSSSNDLDALGRGVGGIALNDSSAAPPSAAGSFSTYMNTRTRPFEFNPVTKEWENDGAQANGNGGPFQRTQGVSPDRGFSTGGPYPGSNRAGSKISVGVPQPAQNAHYPVPVFNPATPNIRTVPATNPRGRGQHFTPQHLSQSYVLPQHYYDPRYSITPQPFNLQYNPALNLNIGLPPSLQYQPTYAHMSFPTGHQARPGRGYDSADATRSPLLREFRMSHKTHKRYDLKDIYGHVVEFCGDQHGSRFIQEKLERANSDEKDRVFGEIINDAIPLMKDVFGNYVVQKIFEHGTQPQKQLLADQMKETLVTLSLDPYGCRVVQKALGYVLSKQRSALIRELEPEILKVMKDTHGNHVVQRAIEAGLPEDLDFIFESFRGRVKELACHTCACRVLQKAMDRSEDVRISVIEEALPHARDLTNDQFGNYVIQHALETGRPEDRTRVINSVLGSVVHLSKQKYASNVVEKCTQYGTPEEVLKIEAEMTATGPDGRTFLHSMIVDQYANYVVQKHWDNTPNEQAFRAALRPALQWARDSGYTGKHVDTIARLLGETSRPQKGTATPSTRHSSAAPGSPLQLDVGSAAPTPNLTMEPNSPSSSPPSTTESAVDEPVSTTLKGRMASATGRRLSPDVQVADDS